MFKTFIFFYLDDYKHLRAHAERLALIFHLSNLQMYLLILIHKIYAIYYMMECHVHVRA